jgi:hypothetical protein
MAHPDRNRLVMAAVMAAAVALGAVAGGAAVLRGLLDRVVDDWTKV